MPQDENAPYEEGTLGGQPALRKSATPLTTSKLLNQGSAKVSINLFNHLHRKVLTIPFRPTTTGPIP